MSHYSAEILWQRGQQDFLGNHYSRAHLWRFDGGAEVPASSSPHVVPLPWSDASGVDPEEAFVASLSSCHMLWFLSLAAKQGFQVERYLDKARGVMARNEDGKLAMTEVTRYPDVTFGAERLPSEAQQRALHHQAHEECFIANSVKTLVRCEPIIRD